jgi:predicted TIM-barrel fold metal-dependent hydrolase
MQGPCYGDQNAYYAELRDRYPDKFIFAFAFVDPRYPEKALRDLDVAIKSHGLNGIKFEPNHTPFWLDDPDLKPVWDKIAELGIVAAIDLGWNPHNEYNMQNDQVEKVIVQYPETPFVLLHFGGSDLGNPDQVYPFPALQKTLELRKYPNVYFEAGGLVMMGEEDEYPYERVQDMIRAVWEKVEPERMFWGSDWPYTNQCCTYPQNVDVLRKHCNFLSEEDKSKILGESAMAFYGERGLH